MTGFLFVVPPLTGHITPLVAVAQRLAAAGHAVVWSGEPAMIRSLAGSDAVVEPVLDRPFEPDTPGENLRGYAAVRFLWESFLVPFADATVDAVAAAALAHRVDVVVADMQALAGPLAADRLGLPWATSATTSAPLRDSFTATPKVRAWLDGLLAGLIGRHASGLDPRTLELSPGLVLAFTTEALVGEGAPARIRYVGPALTTRPGQELPYRRDAFDGRPLVVTTLGTVNGPVSGRFLAACADAFGLLGGRVQALVADPLDVLSGGAPPDLIAAPYLPMLDVLPRADVVICHGGHNTVCEALAHGVPLVIAPIRDDQPVIAAQVVDAGAGVRLRFGRATPEIIRDAVATVLAEPGYRAAARRIRSSFDAAGSAVAAADQLLALARDSTGAREALGPDPVANPLPIR